MSHPNKAPFIGVLTVVDEPSTKAPAGARGHRVLLTKEAAREALGSLIGMGINIATDSANHDPKKKIGIIDNAELCGKEIVVTGYLFQRDFPGEVLKLAASSGYGMSYEIVDARVEDMRAVVWELTRATFTGAAVLLREKAAYTMTDFVVLS